jgi:two-component system, NarL family, invasion response regulator UvrY
MPLEIGDCRIVATKVKVLIIEDHPVVRDGCQRIFSRRSDIVMRDVASAAAGVVMNREFSPDVILLDIALPDGSGFDILPELLATNKQAKVIVFSMYETPRFVQRALEMGATGYITKSDDPNAILKAIEKVQAGSIYLGQAIAQDLAMAKLKPLDNPYRDLTEREHKILGFLGEGKSMTEIAVALSLNYKTIANAVAAIKQKTKVPTNAALTKLAVELRSRN